MVECSRCKQLSGNNALKCFNCGENLNVEFPTQAIGDKYKVKPNIGLGWILCILFSGQTLFIAGLIWLMSGNELAKEYAINALKVLCILLGISIGIPIILSIISLIVEIFYFILYKLGVL